MALSFFQNLTPQVAAPQVKRKEKPDLSAMLSQGMLPGQALQAAMQGRSLFSDTPPQPFQPTMSGLGGLAQYFRHMGAQNNMPMSTPPMTPRMSTYQQSPEYLALLQRARNGLFG